MTKPLQYRQPIHKAPSTPAETFINAGPEAMADRDMANKRRRMIGHVADEQHSDDDASNHEGSGGWTDAERKVDEFLVEGQRQASQAAPKKGAPADTALSGVGGGSTQAAPSTNEDNQPIDQGRGIERQTDQQKDDETKQRR
jgi:hypothetical protein